MKREFSHWSCIRFILYNNSNPPVGLSQLWCDFDKSSTFRNQTYNESASIPDICFYPEVPTKWGVWILQSGPSVVFFSLQRQRQNDELNIHDICSHPEGGLASDNGDWWSHQNVTEKTSIMLLCSQNMQLIDGLKEGVTFYSCKPGLNHISLHVYVTTFSPLEVQDKSFCL